MSVILELIFLGGGGGILSFGVVIFHIHDAEILNLLTPWKLNAPMRKGYE